jgi:adenine phosphoribosyltransferase
MQKRIDTLKSAIRDIPDFPKKGIIFKDITTLLSHGELFKQAIDELADYFKDKGIQKVAAIESRGFIIGAPLAYKLGVGFVPIRKKGKLPYRTITATYQLEYGTDTLEVHEDAIQKGENLLIVDDLLATGGTANATIELAKKLGAKISGIVFMIELTFLNGRKKLKDYDVFSLIKY